MWYNLRMRKGRGNKHQIASQDARRPAGGEAVFGPLQPSALDGMSPLGVTPLQPEVLNTGLRFTNLIEAIGTEEAFARRMEALGERMEKLRKEIPLLRGKER